MEAISSIATMARNSVFGENPTSTQSGTEPPAGDASGKGTSEASHDPGNVPEQVPTQPGTEPPSGGPPGKGTTAEGPSDRGNEPEQVQASGGTAHVAGATDSPPPNTTPASKIDTPDPSSPSEMKSVVASNDAANNPATKVASNAPSETDSVKAKKTGTAKPGSHSALFGLGKKEEGGDGGGATHPPKGSGGVSGTIDEAAEVVNEQAELEKRGTSEDDTGGYVGLKKAAMEEEEKRRNGGATEGRSWMAATAAKTEHEDRDPSNVAPTCTLHVSVLLTPCLSTGSIEKKNSLGREISPGEMPDGTHRKSIAEGMPQGHHFGRRNTSNGEKSGGFRDRLKDKFRSKK